MPETNLVSLAIASVAHRNDAQHGRRSDHHQCRAASRALLFSVSRGAVARGRSSLSLDIPMAIPDQSRVPRSRDDLKRELKEQIGLLRTTCRLYDDGDESAAKLISLTLRLLLHDAGRSRALLSQLDLRDGRYLDTAGPLNASNCFSECRFLFTRVSVSADGGASIRYMPTVADPPPGQPRNRIAFTQWWCNPVLSDKHRRSFSRCDLVMNVANTDGGAHVDPALNAQYAELSRANAMGWSLTGGDVVVAFAERPELACMRQIAFEVLATFESERRFAGYI